MSRADDPVTVDDAIAMLEHQIAECQRRVATLRSISDEMTRPGIGRPRRYGPKEEANVAECIAAGITHREIAAMTGIPVASVGHIAARVGANERSETSAEVRGRLAQFMAAGSITPLRAVELDHFRVSRLANLLAVQGCRC